MNEIKLSLRLTRPEYDTLVECVSDELLMSEISTGEGRALATTCCCLLKKIKEARMASATCASCIYCKPWLEKQLETCNRDRALCFVEGTLPSEAYLSDPACKRYTPRPPQP